MKSYTELIKISTFEERLKYLMLEGSIGAYTFGGHRYLNQTLYNSNKWRRIRRDIIIRDNGCDLGVDGYGLSYATIHHIEPITIDDIINMTSKVFDEDNLITTSTNTHNLIHYMNQTEDLDRFLQSKELIVRKPNDTCLWR